MILELGRQKVQNKTHHYTSTFNQNGQVEAQYTKKGLEDDAVDLVAKR